MKKNKTHKSWSKTTPHLILLQLLTQYMLLDMLFIFNGSFYSKKCKHCHHHTVFKNNKLMCEDMKPNIHYLIDTQWCYITLSLCTLSSYFHPNHLCFLFYSLSWQMSTSYTGENYITIMKGLIVMDSQFWIVIQTPEYY